MCGDGDFQLQPVQSEKGPGTVSSSGTVQAVCKGRPWLQHKVALQQGNKHLLFVLHLSSAPRQEWSLTSSSS